MASQTGIRLIAGLGNPGAEYQNNRHNAGFWFIDYLANKHRAQFKTHAKLKSVICNITLSESIYKAYKAECIYEY